MENKLFEIEENLFTEDDYDLDPPSDIVAYNELRSCADLFRMYTDGMLITQPKFQREIVWSSAAQTRFIDSMIKQLPIPSMCFSLDYKTQKWMIIDGLQRMSTIIRFLSDENWELSTLKDISPKIAGRMVSEFKEYHSSLHKFYEWIINLTLPINVLRCDYSKQHHMNYLFMTFYRLNTGGTKLNNQEIRNCIYNGTFNETLKKLNMNDLWMKINQMEAGKTYRFMKEELILRFFAFHEDFKNYKGSLTRFLNNYMSKNRNLKVNQLDKMETLFVRTVDIIYNKIFHKTSEKLTNSILILLMFGVAENLEYLEKLEEFKVRSLYEKFIAVDLFSEKALIEDISGREKVICRFNNTKEIFSGK